MNEARVLASKRATDAAAKRGAARMAAVETKETTNIKYMVKTRGWECDRTGSRTSDVLAARLGTEPLI